MNWIGLFIILWAMIFILLLGLRINLELKRWKR